MIYNMIIAYVLDIIIGDPYFIPHPVQLIGRVITYLENKLRSPDNTNEYSVITRGIVLTVVVVLLTFFSALGLLKLALFINPILYQIVNIYFIYSSLAIRCLGNEALKVYRVIDCLSAARKQVAMLVGRDTKMLSRKKIIAATVETVAENTVDGIISPMFFYVVGCFFGVGSALMFAFKSISTLDSMVGYKNDKYIFFGRASAKTDDAANFIPARISGVIIPLATLLCGMNPIKSFLIMLRDRKNHKSPNCAYPESAVAGALGVELGGDNLYFGKLVRKPTIGNNTNSLKPSHIKKTVHIMYIASLITLVAGCVVLWFFIDG